VAPLNKRRESGVEQIYGNLCGASSPRFEGFGADAVRAGGSRPPIMADSAILTAAFAEPGNRVRFRWEGFGAKGVHAMRSTLLLRVSSLPLQSPAGKIGKGDGFRGIRKPLVLWAVCLAVGISPSLALAGSDYPDPEKNPESPLMLQGDWVPKNTHDIDFENLPRIPLQHTFVSDVRPQQGVNQHNYLIFHEGKYWIMWSDGPGIEDRVGQRVKFATSPDGLEWSEPRYLTPPPPNSDVDSPHYNTRTDQGYRYISRGFWLREGELLALASLDEAAGFFGPGLELHAFRYRRDSDDWEDLGVISDDTINNFPPKKLPTTGEWMMSRRTHDRNVFFMAGGVEALDDWEYFPAVSRRNPTGGSCRITD
jgi:hypothetical protein